jgi:hypothetical protein
MAGRAHSNRGDAAWPYPIGLGTEPGRKAFVEIWIP